MNELSSMTLRLIAVYARVSTSNQEDQQTIKTQLVAIREFAEKHGYPIVREFLDEGWSGDMLARPALDQLRQDAKLKQWDAVLIYNPDRLARRYSFQELVMDELMEKGVETLFITIPPSKNSEDRLLYGVRGVFAEYERVKIAERFRMGKVRKAKESHIIASEAPYGYMFIPKRGKPGTLDFCQGHYEINQIEAAVVKMIFSMVDDEVLTTKKVVKRLLELDIRPRKSNRGVWSTSTISTLLRNRTYIGEGHYGRSYAVVPQKRLKQITYRKVKKTSRKFKPESEWIKIPTPAILDKEIFERAQVQLKINATLSPRNKKNQYLLGGVIRCSCGRSRVGEGPQHGKYLYYRCTDRVHSFPLASKCTEKGINARIADALIWNKIHKLMLSP